MEQSTWAQPALESRACTECGKPYAATSARQTFCSPPCKRRAMKRRQAERRADEAERQCPRCGEVKATDQFTRLNDSYCRPCLAEYKRTRRQDPDSSFRKAELLRYARLSKDDPEFHRRVVLSRYGLTLESFAALLASQGGACAICRTDQPGGRYNQWHIDHDQKLLPESSRQTRLLRPVRQSPALRELQHRTREFSGRPKSAPRSG